MHPLEKLPRHWPVQVEVFNNDTDEYDYCYTLDLQRGNFPTQGNMAVIRLARESELL